MKITIINGSHRVNSQSQKVAQYILSVLSNIEQCDKSEIFSLSGNPLPLWDQGVWDGDAKWEKLLSPIKIQMAGSDGFVIVTPEWHGQVPAGLKNFFLLMSRKELGHKPALIVSVSSGDGGTYPISELRMSSFKNNRICYIPEHIIIRKVEKVLNNDPASNDERSDSYYRKRLTWVIGMLCEYSRAFRLIRESGITEHSDFTNGM